jgi:hypothetical protein
MSLSNPANPNNPNRNNPKLKHKSVTGITLIDRREPQGAA